MIIFHNPHTKNFFWQTFQDFIFKNIVTKKSAKYKYILDYLWKNNIKFGVFLDYKESSLPSFLRKKIFIKIETFFWLIIKNINPFYVKIIDNVDYINDNDIFFSFCLTTLDTEYHWIDNISDKKFIKIFHFTHFAQNTSLIAKNFERLKADFIIAENNLQNSDYFKKFFINYKKTIYTLPFVFNERFLNKISFNNRLNKCLATWTIIRIDNKYSFPEQFLDLSNFFKTNTLQPIRKEIYENKDKLKNEFDTLIQNTIEENHEPKKYTFLEKIFNIIKIIIFWWKHNYYSIDIVEKYNNYKMFINWEEINDLPWIWFVEWMACWCAYIGKIDPMYTDIWLIPGIHYIWHNWTLENIIEKIKYYQEHSDELEKIANNWYKYVIENFNWEIVAKKFIEDLEKLHINFSKNNNKDNLDFKCSFIK